MSSAAASLNQSTESAISSGQRSGLNISVGDTKSIVLALQALQSKIRALENDKNYHQDQYEQTMKSHDVYKQNMQRQVELERAAHHKRERELLDELRKAQDENANLQNALNGRRDCETNDLSKLRAEIELTVAQEKRSAAERESKLQSEIDRLRGEIEAQRRKESETRATLESLRAERDGVEQTNVQLRRAMDELLSTYEKEKEERVEYGNNKNNGNNYQQQHKLEEYHEQQQEYYAMKPTRAVSAQTVNKTRSISAARMQQTRAATPRSNIHPLYSRPRSLSKGNYSELTWSSYRDPTCNSMLRDVRNVHGVGICRTHTPPIQRQSHSHSLEASNAPLMRQNYSTNQKNNSRVMKKMESKRVNEQSVLYPKINNMLERSNVYFNGVNHYPRNKVMQRENSRLQQLHGMEQNRHIVHLPESVNGEPMNKESKAKNSRAQNQSKSNVNSSFDNSALQTTGFEAVNTVEAQLRSELNELHAQYRDTVERGAAEEIPNDVLTGALSHISRLIDHKVEQLRLINDAQRELSVISTSYGKSFTSSEREANAIDKTTQRTLLMNEIREMLAKTAKVV